FADRGAQGDHARAAGEHDETSVRPPDQNVMRDRLAAVLKGGPRLQRHRILPAFLVDEMNALAVLQPCHGEFILGDWSGLCNRTTGGVVPWQGIGWAVSSSYIRAHS